MKRRAHWSEVLRYQQTPPTRATVRRAYRQYRLEHGIPERCDLPDCQFHVEPLVWKAGPLKLILDHADGVNCNNRPSNLRYLCPNCDAQQSTTRGGANKGRVAKHIDGFTIKRPDGTRLHDVEVKLPVAAGISADAVVIRNGRVLT